MPRRRAGTFALVSVDGLSLTGFADLAALLPRSARYLEQGQTCRLDAGPLTTAAAIWAEVLTGVAWYENGCAGHGRPGNSLNGTQIMTERDLAVPVTLLNGESRQLVVNVPLVVPRDPTRLWLSDGSLPLAMAASPPAMMADEPHRSYKARPYTALAQGIGYHEGAIRGCIEIEEHRLRCAAALLRSARPEMSIIRLSFFDQLAHVLGPGCLAEQDLRYADDIRQFLDVFDAWLADLFSEIGHVVLLSTFSHVPCESRVSLNGLLEAGGFLTFARPDATAARRVAALAALTESGQWGAAEYAAVGYTHERSQQSFTDGARTLAASPVLGCVYVNARDRFHDGAVERGAVAATRRAARAFLEEILGRSFGNGYSIWSVDALSDEIAETHKALLPDLLVHIQGAELHNSTDALFGPRDRPRSVHRPHGFIWARGECPEEIQTKSVCSALRTLW